jgi:hypothetical protein
MHPMDSGTALWSAFSRQATRETAREIMSGRFFDSYWASRSAEQVEIQRLQRLLEEQVIWSKQSAQDVLVRDQIIRDLHAQLADRDQTIQMLTQELTGRCFRWWLTKAFARSLRLAFPGLRHAPTVRRLTRLARARGLDRPLRSLLYFLTI